MKIFAYNYREFDEAEYFQKFSARTPRLWKMRIWRRVMNM